MSLLTKNLFLSHYIMFCSSFFCVISSQTKKHFEILTVDTKKVQKVKLGIILGGGVLG